MSRHCDVNSEPYNAYLTPNQIKNLKPKNVFYTTDLGIKCGRYYCAVCGECNLAVSNPSTRFIDYLTCTTLPDAAYHATEAHIINDYVQERFREERRKLYEDHH
ncbi:unnamed protein product [Hymenolepis diminuta]|uniref:Uncharacterized protein n=2 Tax=Hymenolepis diminuta TaxID=6216 RepID=A0A0R3SFM4_HYMDI|nr:unnamed protein product [Hymenolepis diminuta]